MAATRAAPASTARFGLDDEALANYGKESVKKTHDVAMAIVKKAYGRAPARFYFIGGSQGGHEALDAAARYPPTTTASWPTTPPTTSRCCTSGSFNVGRALYEGKRRRLDGRAST